MRADPDRARQPEFIDFSPNRPVRSPRAASRYRAPPSGGNHESTCGVDRFAGHFVGRCPGQAPSAQDIPPKSIEDQVLGWIKVYDYKGATLPITVDTRVYSPAQLSIAQLFANWMQASYLPKGALGDVLQIRNAKLSPYNQNTAA